MKGISVYSENMVVMMQATMSLDSHGMNRGQENASDGAGVKQMVEVIRSYSQLGLVGRSHVDEDVLGLEGDFRVWSRNREHERQHGQV